MHVDLVVDAVVLGERPEDYRVRYLSRCKKTCVAGVRSVSDTISNGDATVLEVALFVGAGMANAPHASSKH